MVDGPGQDSRPVCFLLGSIGEDDHDSRHMVTSPSYSTLLAERPCPAHQVPERRYGRWMKLVTQIRGNDRVESRICRD